MAEKGSEKKLLMLIVVLVALSLVVDLLSINVLYSIRDSGNLGGELGESSIRISSVLKKDKCVAYCTNDCGIYWDTWYNTCMANCQVRYDSGELTTKQFRACKNACFNTRWGDNQCASYCSNYAGGNPDTGACCYQDWITHEDGTFECVYYF